MGLSTGARLKSKVFRNTLPPLKVPRGTLRGGKVFRNTLDFNRAPVDNPIEDLLNGCAVSDPVGHVTTTVLWHRTVPLGSAGVGQDPTAAWISSRHLDGVFHPSLVLIREDNELGRIKVTAIPFWIKSTRATEAGDGREAQLTHPVSAAFTLNPGHEWRAFIECREGFLESIGND